MNPGIADMPFASMTFPLVVEVRRPQQKQSFHPAPQWIRVNDGSIRDNDSCIRDGEILRGERCQRRDQ
jgi:hypothetical protein